VLIPIPENNGNYTAAIIMEYKVSKYEEDLEADA
jgi:hypothetical protein